MINKNSLADILKGFALSISFLPKKEKFNAVGLVGIYVLLGILDIVAVLIFGLVGSLAVSGLQFQEPTSRVGQILTLLNIQDSTLQVQMITLGGLAALLLTSKSISTLYLSKITLRYYGYRSAVMSSSLLRKILQNDLTHFRSSSLQESIYALTTGTHAVSVGIIGTGILLVADVILIVIFGISLLFVDITLAVATIILFSAVGIFLYKILQSRARDLGERLWKLEVDSANSISELIQCFREISIRNRRVHYAEKIGSKRFQLAEANASMGIISLLSKYVMEVTLIMGGVVIAISQFLTQTPTRAVGMISLFLVSSTRVIPAVLRIQNGLITLRANVSTARPTIDLIKKYEAMTVDTIECIKDFPSKIEQEYKGFSGAVEMIDVTFSYTGKGKAIVRRVNLDVKPGEFIGIVGGSGEGKSTLADLMLGIYTPSSGLVRISGVPPKIAISKWPGAIAYVPQEVYVVQGTIKENVCLGFDPKQVPDEDVVDVLKLANLEDLASGADGIHALIGDKHRGLSGGQKQRLAIARALITRPKLLILDEATSALDGVTERKMIEQLNFWKRQGVTVIMIAHRLAAIKRADKIVLIEKGEVSMQGKFSELKSKSKYFRSQAKAMGI